MIHKVKVGVVEEHPTIAGVLIVKEIAEVNIEEGITTVGEALEMAGIAVEESEI